MRRRRIVLLLLLAGLTGAAAPAAMAAQGVLDFSTDERASPTSRRKMLNSSCSSFSQSQRKGSSARGDSSDPRSASTRSTRTSFSMRV